MMGKIFSNFAGKKWVRVEFFAALTLALLTVVTFKSIIGENPYGSSVASQGRAPASVSSMAVSSGELEDLKGFVKTIEIGCAQGEYKKSFVAQSKQVRLISSECKASGKRRLVSVVNRTSGVSGMTFSLPGEKGFSTDYIPLSKGENRIVLEIEFDGKIRTSEITILRPELVAGN